MLYFTSDNHFFHEASIRYCQRPFESGGAMNEAMREIWNRTVSPKDTVWMLGDVGFAKNTTLVPFLQTLNGTKHLVYGNHDKALRQHADTLIKDGVFASMQDYKEVKHDGHRFILSHYAHRVWDKCHYGSIHLFGHSHGESEPWGKSVDVGVDDKNITDEYRPVSVDEVLAFMRERPTHIKHHGRGEE